jgi:hypothetical protein
MTAHDRRCAVTKAVPARFFPRSDRHDHVHDHVVDTAVMADHLPRQHGHDAIERSDDEALEKDGSRRA